MNHPEDLKLQQNEAEQPLENPTPTVQENVPAAQENAPAAQENASAAQESAPAAQESAPAPAVPREKFPKKEGPVGVPHWYAVSYQGNAGPAAVKPMNAGVPPVRKKRRKTAFVCLIVAVCILASALAGVGGYLLTGYLDQLESDFEQNLLNGLTGTEDSIGAEAYPYDKSNYDYAQAFAEISKNDGAGLLNSPNGSAGDAKKSLIEVTAAVRDSVVEITTAVVSNRGNSIVAGAGSGVIIHEDGVIVTNNHVIAGHDKIYVRLTNGDTYEAVARGTDEAGDIAILKITPQPGKPLTVAKLGSSKSLLLGEEVIAIGNPLGELGGTVTNGIISALAREVAIDGNVMTLLQTNAAINSGNSGGGLFNMAGELIGVVNAKYAASGVEGLGFAIPIDTAYAVSIKDLMESGYVRGVPSLGIKLTEKTGGNFLNVIYGAYVSDPGENTPFKEGDYIYSIDGTVVYGISTSALDAVNGIVRRHKVGDTLSVVVKRGSEQVTLSVTLTEYVPDYIGTQG